MPCPFGIGTKCKHDPRSRPGFVIAATGREKCRLKFFAFSPFDSPDRGWIYSRFSKDSRRHMGVLDQRFEKNFMISSVDYVFNWARKSAIWPLTFGLACCAIEMIAATTSRFDIARFGAEVFRPSPRQSDLLIVAGAVTLKMAPVLKRGGDRMPDPKGGISMGACSSLGGPFNTHPRLQGVAKNVPPPRSGLGCPPAP